MIRINQIKIHNDLNTSKTKEELFDMLYQKASKLLRINRSDIESLEIIRHSIDARKKPDIFDVYMVDISVTTGSEEKIVKKCKDKNISVVSVAKYNFEEMAKAAKAKVSEHVDKDGKIVGLF